MDIEEQVRLNFLDEAHDYCDRLESVLLELSSRVAEPQQLDLALRLGHSVKGGAAMMDFTSLSNVAHLLEDFLKILRVRHHSTQISTEVQGLLLQGVDCLRQVCDLQRQGIDIETSGLNNQIHNIFEQLRQHLGDLLESDENALLEQSEEADPELLMFEEEVETILDQFAEDVSKLQGKALSEELITTAQKLTMCGQIVNLEPFIQLSLSIEEQAPKCNTEQIEFLTQQALTTWRRSLALVSRGSLEKLPSHVNVIPDLSIPETELEDLDLDISAIQAEFASFDLNDFNAEDLELSQAVFSLEEDQEEDQLEDQGKYQEEEEDVSVVLVKTPIAKPRSNSEHDNQTVRIPVNQLYKLNTLLGKLFIERNAVNLKLEQLKKYAELMRQRMYQLEKSNLDLRKWQDRASIEAASPVTEHLSATNHHKQDQFDTLEMDRYTSLHLISQEQIETIVQLEEVSTDIELGLTEMSQGIGSLNETTRTLQQTATRIQMVRFIDVVKRFPRVARELSLKFNKQVNLKIEGETTLIDRAIVETLNAPLIHLLNNALDHGIENPATRIAAGKSPQGNITLKAVNQGTQTIITFEDDGGGISLRKIRDRLYEMGISKREINKMSEPEILEHIFHPGFSTIEKVTKISGRGVGLDVVRNNIQDIRGNIKVHTKPGLGTTYIITIPFSLSIVRVMLLDRSGIIFAVLVNSVRELMPLQKELISSIQDVDQLRWRKQMVPIVRLEDNLKFYRPHKSFEMFGNPIINKPTILVVGNESQFGGIYIDRFWGEKEVTVRPINSPLPLPVGFISSVVLGDGRVIPLVDPFQLIQSCLASQKLIDNTPNLATSDQVNKILVIDDSINVRRYLAFTLTKAGYQVEQAQDGQSAVDKLCGGLSVDAVICDIEMPRLDGYGVLEELKGKPEFATLPIIMLTSRSNPKHRKLAMNLGASSYFSKPYNEQQLLQTLAELIIAYHSIMNFS